MLSLRLYMLSARPGDTSRLVGYRLVPGLPVPAQETEMGETPIDIQKETCPRMNGMSKLSPDQTGAPGALFNWRPGT